MTGFPPEDTFAETTTGDQRPAARDPKPSFGATHRTRCFAPPIISKAPLIHQVANAGQGSFHASLPPLATSQAIE
jgi:hypothetical protein